jgi:hypothetical protein
MPSPGLQLMRRSSALGAILALCVGRPAFTADAYAVDGVTGKVASFIDRNDPTHTLAQAVSARQVVLPVAHADFGGKLCANFTGAEWYQSSRAATAWNFLLDGTGAEWLHSMTHTSSTGTQVYWSTGNSANFNSAIYLSSPTLFWEQYANPTQVFSRTRTATAVGTPTYYTGFYVEGASPETSLRVKAGTADTGATAIAPTAPPSASLVLGANALGAQRGIMRWRELLFFPILTPTQRSLLAAYELSAHGIS